VLFEDEFNNYYDSLVEHGFKFIISTTTIDVMSSPIGGAVPIDNAAS
jgi:hypothetical protein